MTILITHHDVWSVSMTESWVFYQLFFWEIKVDTDNTWATKPDHTPV